MIQKFRVWDKSNKCWQYDFVIDQMGRLHMVGNMDSLQVLEERFIVNFSTGLKAKNGKEIFEGDILKIIATWAQIEMTIRIAWERGKFRAHCLTGAAAAWTLRDDAILWHSSEYEVIGNIHENSELLKVK